MVNIYCDTITKEFLRVAQQIAKCQKTNVRLSTATETLEVSYEKESEKEKAKETKPKTKIT